MSKTVDPSVKVGHRFQADGPNGPKGWVRYIGPVETQSGDEGKDSKDKIYAGVEWDDVGRGKHDGKVGQKRYFQCGECCGSFVHPKRLQMGVSLREAVRTKYANQDPDPNEGQRYLVAQNAPDKKSFQVPVVFVGQEQFKKQISVLEKLERVVVHDGLVEGPGPDGDIAAHLPNITELDLENNLLTDWGAVAAITRQLRLSELRLSRNPLMSLPAEPADLFANSLHSLIILFLNDVPNAFQQVCLLAAGGCLSNLEELHLCKNKLTQLRVPPSLCSGTGGERKGDGVERASLEQEQAVLHAAFPALRELDLSSNAIESWDEVLRVATLPSLRKLLLNENAITRLFYPEDSKEAKGRAFGQLTWLSMNDNRIADMESVDCLDRFPHLSELRFQRNPIGDQLTAASFRCILIAKLPRLRMLNLGDVRPRERSDSEKFYLKWCLEQMEKKTDESSDPAVQAQNEVAAMEQASKTFYRFSVLLEQHGKFMGLDSQSTGPAPAQASQTLAKKLVALSLFNGPEDPEPKTKKLPPSMTVGDLKALLQRLFKISQEQQRIIYRDSPDDPKPQVLDDNIKQLSFYGVAGGGQLIVEEKTE